MEQSKIDMFLAQNANMFPSQKIILIKEALSKLDENKFMYVQSMQFKDPSTILIISILVGSLGIDRFMLGDTGLGVLKLLTCGGIYVWWIVDMISAQDRAKEYNYKQFMQTLSFQGVQGLMY